MSISTFFKRLLVEQPKRLLAVLAALVFAGLLEGSSIALFIPLLQMIQAGGETTEPGRIGRAIQTFLSWWGLPLTLGSVLVLIFLAVFTLQLALMLEEKLFLRSQYRFEASLRQRLYQAMFAAEWPFFTKQKAGDINNALTLEVSRAGQAFFLLHSILATAIVAGTYVFLAVVISWRMALSAGVVGLVAGLLLQRLINRAKDEGEEITQANVDVQSEAIEQVAGAKLVKGCAVEESTVDRFGRYVDTLAEIQFRTTFENVKLKTIHEVVVVGLLCVGIYMAVASLKMPIATLIVFLIIFYRLAPRLSNLQRARHNLKLCIPGLERIDALTAEAASMREKGGAREVGALTQGVRLNNVDFAYTAGHEVVRGLNLTIPKGKTVAIVGSSGAGKSTVVDLVLGLLKPTAGEVFLDDLPLHSYDLKSWRRRLGYVAQDTVLFHDTVRANIGWMAPGATEADIKAAAEAAYAREFIDGLPEGFDTIVGDRGVRLSGGQRQRLALARALVRKPDILILDEATSALDAESEQKIQRAVEELSQSAMTIVIVTHRLATVKNADIIYVLENGELIEEGNWETLAKGQGRFQKLKHLQALD